MHREPSWCTLTLEETSTLGEDSMTAENTPTPALLALFTKCVEEEFAELKKNGPFAGCASSC
jgi:hypothetical protein